MTPGLLRLRPLSEGKARWALVAAVLLAPAMARAQTDQVASPPSLVGLVNWVDGDVSLRGPLGDAIWDGQLMAVYAGQTIVSAHGRAEVMLGRDCFLRLDEFSEVELTRPDPESVSLGLVAGSMILDVVRDKRESVVLLGSGSQVQVGRKGVYRIDAPEGTPARVRVFRGRATASAGDRQEELKARQSVELAGDLSAVEFDRSERDGFDEWSSKRKTQILQTKRRGAQPDYDVAAAAVVATIINSSRVNAVRPRGTTPVPPAGGR